MTRHLPLFTHLDGSVYYTEVTLRDIFAGLIAAGRAATAHVSHAESSRTGLAQWAFDAYELADALLSERERRS